MSKRNTNGQFTLGDLIEVLKGMPKDKELVIACDYSDSVFRRHLDGGVFAYPSLHIPIALIVGVEFTQS